MKGRDVTMTEVQGRLKGLLGDLESEIMTWLWGQPRGEITVRRVYEAVGLAKRPPLAYTTIMTVMSHLADKGLLHRHHQGKTHYYQVIQSRDEFLTSVAARQVERLVANFGDLALAQFAEQLAAIDPKRLVRIHKMLEDDSGEER
jgi:predicted transcriptional regulator